MQFDSKFNYFSQLIHIGNHYNILCKMLEPVDSILKMAMLISIIRPAKKNLVGKSWSEVEKSVWIKESVDRYGFSKAHALAYAHLVVVNMNLLNGI